MREPKPEFWTSILWAVLSFSWLDIISQSNLSISELASVWLENLNSSSFWAQKTFTIALKAWLISSISAQWFLISVILSVMSVFRVERSAVRSAESYESSIGKSGFDEKLLGLQMELGFETSWRRWVRTSRGLGWSITVEKAGGTGLSLGSRDLFWEESDWTDSMRLWSLFLPLIYSWPPLPKEARIPLYPSREGVSRGFSWLAESSLISMLSSPIFLFMNILSSSSWVGTRRNTSKESWCGYSFSILRKYFWAWDLI